MSIFTRTDKSMLGSWWWTVDRVTLTVLLIIAVIGIMLVAAASPPVALRIGVDANHFTIRHLIVLVPALAAMVGISMLSLQQVWRLSVLVFAGSVIAMVLVLFIGEEIKGAQRWIHLPGFSLQPSEFVKASFVVVSAWFIARQKEKASIPGFGIAIGLYGVVVGLLLLQPDMGMTFVISCCFFAVIFLAGLPFRWIALLGTLAIGAAFAAYYGFDHVRSRVDRFLDPASGDTYQIDKSLAAFQNGGVFGTGPGQGTVKQTIPDAHADFIFAVAGEELGMLAALLIVALFACILVRGYNRIMDTDNLFVILASGGILTMFGLQALVNMGSTLSLMPTKGMTLPFISYGGSSLLASGIAMGMLLALTRRQGRSGIARGGLSIRPIGGNVS